MPTVPFSADHISTAFEYNDIELHSHFSADFVRWRYFSVPSSRKAQYERDIGHECALTVIKPAALGNDRMRSQYILLNRSQCMEKDEYAGEGAQWKKMTTAGAEVEGERSRGGG
jgi:hypothetical protein